MHRARIVVIGIVQTMTSRLRLRGETTYSIRQSLTPEKTSEQTKKCSILRFKAGFGDDPPPIRKRA
jgi:hypothetical protein